MLTFGHATLPDLLSWVIALTLGLKVVATLILLNVMQDVWDRPGWGAMLWWATKLTPVIAVPCAIWLCRLRGMTNEGWIFAALLVFVAVTVPFKIRQRGKRIRRRMTP